MTPKYPYYVRRAKNELEITFQYERHYIRGRCKYITVARVEIDDKDKGTIYPIRIGPFKTQASALQRAKKILQGTNAKTWLEL